MIFKNLRKYTKTIMWLIAIFIVPAFVIWNIGSAVRSRRSGFAGKLFDKKITWKEFLTEKRAAYNDAWLRYGDNVDPKLNLDEQAWTRLIILHEAKKDKIKVSNKELLEHIKALPLFQHSKLTPQIYAMIIARAFQQSPAEFEKGARHSIIIQKYVDKLVSDLKVTDEEIKNAYKNDNEQASISYILVESKNFLDSVTTDDQEAIKSYYENNKQDFKKQEQVDVEYIEIKLESFKDKIEITDENIKNYYDENKGQFKREKKEGQKKTDIEYKSLKEVTDSIKDILAEKEMANRASDLARQIMSKLYGDDDLSAAANEFGLEAKSTGPFSMFEQIPNVGLSFPFLKAAFSLEVGEISEIIKTPTAYYILKPVKKIPPYVPAYENIKDEVKEAYKVAQSEKIAFEKAKQIRSQLLTLIKDKQLDFKAAAKKLGFEAQDAAGVTRNGYIKEIGFAENLPTSVFNLKPKQISEPLKTPQGYCLAELKEIIPIDQEKFAKEKDDYENRVLTKKRDKFLNDWFEKIKIEANPQSYVEENELE